MEKRTRKRKTRSDKIQFTKKEINQIEVMAAMGLSNRQISSWFSMSEDTFYRRLSEENIDLNAALSRGRSKVQFELANKAYELAMAGNTSMIKYVLGCRFKWTDASHIKDEVKVEEVSGGNFGIRKRLVEEMSYEELGVYQGLWEKVINFEDKIKERLDSKAQKHLV